MLGKLTCQVEILARKLQEFILGEQIENSHIFNALQIICRDEVREDVWNNSLYNKKIQLEVVGFVFHATISKLVRRSLTKGRHKCNPINSIMAQRELDSFANAPNAYYAVNSVLASTVLSLYGSHSQSSKSQLRYELTDSSDYYQPVSLRLARTLNSSIIRFQVGVVRVTLLHL